MCVLNYIGGKTSDGEVNVLVDKVFHPKRSTYDNKIVNSNMSLMKLCYMYLSQ